MRPTQPQGWFILLILASGYATQGHPRQAIEQQVAGASQAFSENLSTIIDQVTRELTDKGKAVEQLQLAP